jgi:hypothetical protein
VLPFTLGENGSAGKPVLEHSLVFSFQGALGGTVDQLGDDAAKH